MNAPTISTIARDDESDITFEIMAYRKLTSKETGAVISKYIEGKKGKVKPKQTIKIQCMIGQEPGL